MFGILNRSQSDSLGNCVSSILLRTAVDLIFGSMGPVGTRNTCTMYHVMSALLNTPFAAEMMCAAEHAQINFEKNGKGDR